MNKYIVHYRDNRQLAQAHIFAQSAKDAEEKIGLVDCVCRIEPFGAKLTYNQVIDMLGEYVNDYHLQQFVLAALEYFDLIGW